MGRGFFDAGCRVPPLCCLWVCISPCVCVVCQLYKQRGRPSPWQRLVSPSACLPAGRWVVCRPPSRFHASQSVLSRFFVVVVFIFLPQTNYLGKICMGEKEGDQGSWGSIFHFIFLAKRKKFLFFFCRESCGNSCTDLFMALVNVSCPS